MRGLIFAAFVIGRFAGAVPIDSNGILPKLDLFLAGPTFSSAFQAGDRIDYEFHECYGKDNCSRPDPLFALLERKDDRIVINHYSKATPDVSFSTESLSEANWEGAHRNHLRLRIDSIEQFGVAVEVLSMESVPCPELAAGHQCVKVALSGKSSLTDISYQAIMTAAASGLSQILIWKQAEAGLLRREIEQTILSVTRPTL